MRKSLVPALAGPPALGRPRVGAPQLRPGLRTFRRGRRSSHEWRASQSRQQRRRRAPRGSSRPPSAGRCHAARAHGGHLHPSAPTAASASATVHRAAGQALKRTHHQRDGRRHRQVQLRSGALKIVGSSGSARWSAVGQRCRSSAGQAGPPRRPDRSRVPRKRRGGRIGLAVAADHGPPRDRIERSVGLLAYVERRSGSLDLGRAIIRGLGSGLRHRRDAVSALRGVWRRPELNPRALTRVCGLVGGDVHSAPVARRTRPAVVPATDAVAASARVGA